MRTYLSGCWGSPAGFPEAEPPLDFVLNLNSLNFFFSFSSLSASLSVGAARPASLLEKRLFRRDFLAELFAISSGSGGGRGGGGGGLGAVRVGWVTRGRRRARRSGGTPVRVVLADGWQLPHFLPDCSAQVWRHALRELRPNPAGRRRSCGPTCADKVETSSNPASENRTGAENKKVAISLATNLSGPTGGLKVRKTMT